MKTNTAHPAAVQSRSPVGLPSVPPRAEEEHHHQHHHCWYAIPVWPNVHQSLLTLTTLAWKHEGS
ncbi:hypothetical protein E2C01_095190 [Portunus trituberculatus]|uniref:Uncharacterized protein n=1 Tax=Portunus trituberculatus TaxID=210409 RepID=A0A5B7JZJ6_PORTR|nr:hypothetical protein [Portunus trituberculatus]